MSINKILTLQQWIRRIILVEADLRGLSMIYGPDTKYTTIIARCRNLVGSTCISINDILRDCLADIINRRRGCIY